MSYNTPALSHPGNSSSGTSQDQVEEGVIIVGGRHIRVSTRELTLVDCKLEVLSCKIGQLQQLTQLHLYNGRLQALPPEIGQLQQLTRLDLHNNRLRALPSEIGQLQQLTELYLSNNQLHELPSKVGQLQQLTRLDLHNNRLRALPSEIGQLQQLTELYLSNNQLHELPSEIGQLQQLTILYLSDNQLQALPSKVGQLQQLTRLDLHNNRLRALPSEIGQLQQLTELYLSNNQLHELPSKVGQLQQLTRLDLSDNRLRALPSEIGQLQQLTQLYLSDNRLRALPSEIGQLQQLTQLHLYNNRLQMLPPEIGQLQQLTGLYLSRNQLQALPPEIGMLNKLNILQVHDNPLLVELPLTLGEISGLTLLNVDDTAINPVQRDAILQRCRTLRESKASQLLPALLKSWCAYAEMEDVWPPLEEVQQQRTLYEWLTRLARTRDFANRQQRLAKIVCEILLTVHIDRDFRLRFFDLIAADLTRCEDRAAMSLNLVYTEWRLHQLPEAAPLADRVAFLVGYARTLKLRELITEKFSDREESVEIFLHAETTLKEGLELISAVEGMVYRKIGQVEGLNLDDLATQIKALSKTELISELGAWEQYLRKSCAEEMEAIDAWVLAETETLEAEKEDTMSDATYLEGFQKIGEEKRKKICTLTTKILSEAQVDIAK